MLDTPSMPVHGALTLSDAPVASMTAGCPSGGGLLRGGMSSSKSRWRAMPWPFRRAALRLRLEEPDAVPDGPLASLVSLGCAAGLSVPEMCAAASVERHELLTLADGEAVGRLAMAIAEALHAQARHVEAVVEARRGGKETRPPFGKG